MEMNNDSGFAKKCKSGIQLISKAYSVIVHAGKIPILSV
jgi:hypothetical protein